MEASLLDRSIYKPFSFNRVYIIVNKCKLSLQFYDVWWDHIGFGLTKKKCRPFGEIVKTGIIGCCHLTTNEDSLVHYSDVIMGAMVSQITSLKIVYSIVYSDANQRKHQSSVSLAFVREIRRWPVNSPHKWPETRKMFPFDDVIMNSVKMVHQLVQTESDNH